jgi:uncharacterized protein YecE (DUF72 family)
LPRASQLTAAAAPALAPSLPNLFIGTSGWAYPTWKPGFYPANVPSRAFLHFYASQLNSVEVNYTFGSTLKPGQLEGWLDAVPPGFRFSFKAPQRITHFQRLRESHDTLTEFLLTLEPARTAGKLGPILFQLPPNFKPDHERLATFLKAGVFASHALQFAFEFRHPGWFCQATYDLLHRSNVALCIAENDALATPEVHTANFRCYRLRRDGGYKPAQLKAFAKKFTTLAKDGELFAYLKHEDEPTGALNATALLRHANSSRSRAR